MREIKFRAWSEPTKEMEYNITSIDFKGETVYFDSGVTSPNKEQETDYWHKPFVLMQYTGLKDKNGVEIYERDIVRYEDGEFGYIGVVTEDCYYFYIDGISPLDSFSFADVSSTYDHSTELFVIGNMYENHELLEVLG
ncbi:hypothetical protein IW492_02840 [Enterococcus sp. BWB1-3]|uniref:YopX family protein n=1 Tax=Enterococcus sp. BWB1-3 TaxID=2787713 RepID=UPI0019228D94|nr:YopX family protein [Enterococcus sp. BWB1-3]MBL1228168.1 hypothetical protein [Enterococcus sp. BWB1-3]